MSIRTILAAVSGGGASAGASDLACQLARRFEAHLEGLHVVPDPAALFAAAGEGIGSPASAAIVETMMQEATTKAAEARVIFDAAVNRHGIARGTRPQLAPSRPSACWREESGNAANLVARRGRFFDLIVLGRSDRVVQEPHSDSIEETLVRSGRPVLLAPSEPPSGIGYVVAVGWNGSPQAVRALAAARPFLEKANAVLLITAGDADADESVAAVDYLAWHGVQAEHRKIAAASRRRAGQVLLAAARDAGADLLVMGAYGHAPWREQLFGGATRSAVAAMLLPLLLVH
jgi:nucleotide-binding universal stress UspA family protein